MRYQLSKDDDWVCIEFTGILNALDLIMLQQSEEYKTAMKSPKKLVMDVTGISGSELTDEDIHGLAMLGKLDSPREQNLHLIIVVGQQDSTQIVQVCEQIFADTSWKVEVAESIAQAHQLFS
ncbi:MAG: hypothetical protein ACI88A_000169 [Paraglaciecola sp.]|jgi:hypothetical protein